MLLSCYPDIPDNTCRLSPLGSTVTLRTHATAAHYLSASQSLWWVPITHIPVQLPYNCQLATSIFFQDVTLCIIINRWFSVLILCLSIFSINMYFKLIMATARSVCYKFWLSKAWKDFFEQINKLTIVNCDLRHIGHLNVIWFQ